LILRARAARRRRSAGLTYFFFPLDFVADRRALADFAELAFFEAAGLVTFFFFWLVVDPDAFVDLAFGASLRFPSTGTTAIRAQSTAARIRAGACVGTREGAECIVSMYDGFGPSEHQRITTVTYPVLSGSPARSRTRPEILISPPTSVYYT
jgi:hypothetical protein